MTTTIDTYTASTGTTILLRPLDEIAADLAHLPSDERALALEEHADRADVWTRTYATGQSDEGSARTYRVLAVNLPGGDSIGVDVETEGQTVNVIAGGLGLSAHEFTAYAQGLAAIAEYVETVLVNGAAS